MEKKLYQKRLTQVRQKGHVYIVNMTVMDYFRAFEYISQTKNAIFNADRDGVYCFQDYVSKSFPGAYFKSSIGGVKDSPTAPDETVWAELSPKSVT
eukprot:UN19416